jgi:hypothetical protein
MQIQDECAGKSTSMPNIAEIIDSVGRAFGLGGGTAVVKFRVDQENSTHPSRLRYPKLVANKQSFFSNDYGGKSHTASINIEMRWFMLNERKGFEASQARCIEIFAVKVMDSSSRMRELQSRGDASSENFFLPAQLVYEMISLISTTYTEVNAFTLTMSTTLMYRVETILMTVALPLTLVGTFSELICQQMHPQELLKSLQLQDFDSHWKAIININTVGYLSTNFRTSASHQPLQQVSLRESYSKR